MQGLNRTPTRKEGLETEAQLQFLRTVFGKKLPVYLLGSYAGDALLHGSLSSPHHDIDMATLRSNTVMLKQEFENMGLRMSEEAFAQGEQPYKLLVKGKNLLVDVALFDSDRDGVPYMNGVNPRTRERFKVVFDEKVFDDTPQEINGIPVTTISPLALIRSKDAHFQVGIKPSREKDVARKKILVEKFYPNEDPNSDYFNLRIEKVN